jgi:hypothetical protein
LLAGWATIPDSQVMLVRVGIAEVGFRNGKQGSRAVFSTIFFYFGLFTLLEDTKEDKAKPCTRMS